MAGHVSDNVLYGCDGEKLYALSLSDGKFKRQLDIKKEGKAGKITGDKAWAVKVEKSSFSASGRRRGGQSPVKSCGLRIAVTISSSSATRRSSVSTKMAHWYGLMHGSKTTTRGICSSIPPSSVPTTTSFTPAKAFTASTARPERSSGRTRMSKGSSIW